MLRRFASVRIAAAILLMIVGAIGVVIPILPGVPILLVGLAMIRPEHPAVRPVRRLIARFRR